MSDFKKKIKLSYTREFNSFNAYYFESFINEYFEMIPFIDGKPNQNILLGLDYKTNIDRIGNSLDNCRSIIVDNLQECNIPSEIENLKDYREKILFLTMGEHNHPWLNIVSVKNWMWYFESPWYHSRDYHLYRPNLVDSPKLFFMPMRRRKIGRDLIYKELEDLLPKSSIFSYVEQKISLPGIPDEHKEDQRWFNSEWYDQTCFSVVNEDSEDDQPKLYSEKTCKPLAFYHPFILLAQQGVLKMIQDAGFETFPELFDESYDSILNIIDRAEFVSNQIRNFDIASARSPVVLEKLIHNHNRFFDQALIFKCIKNEVIDTILEFLSTR